MSELSGYEKFKARVAAYAEAVRPVYAERSAHCWLWHKWGPWQPYKQNYKRYMADKQWHTGFDWRQRRACLRCGRTQDEEI